MSLGPGLPTYVSPPVHPPAPEYRLYTPGGVGWASFVGTPLAGGIVMAINQRRLGNPAAAWGALGLGLLVFAVIIAIAFVVPEDVPSTPFVVGATLGMYGIARAMQAETLDRHVSLGGETASNWKAAGIGLLVGVVLLTIAVPLIFYASDPGTLYAHSPHEEIYYAGDATRADAERLGAGLVEIQWFGSDGEKTGFLERDGEETIVTLVAGVRDWTREPERTLLRELADQLKRATDASHLTLRMVDRDLNPMAEVQGQ